MAVALAANASTITFGGTAVANLRSISHSESAAAVDITDLADTHKTYRTGIPDIEISCDVVGTGSTSYGVGDTGIIVLTWMATATMVLTPTVFVVSGVDTSGDMDGEITSTLTFKPHT